MSEKQNASDTVTVLPPSPYGICFDLKTDRFQLEEATRSGSFDMKYRHYHSTYEIYYLLEGNRYHFIDRNIFFVQPGSLDCQKQDSQNLSCRTAFPSPFLN